MQWYELRLKLPNSISMNTPALKRKYFIIDSFAIGSASPQSNNYNGSGNPAAVVFTNKNPNFSPDSGELKNDDERQELALLAKEFNLSETTFLWKLPASRSGENGSVINAWAIRYFTLDGSEVDLCGHATLAAAKALFSLYDRNDDQNIKSSMTQNKIIFIAKKNVRLTITRQLATSSEKTNKPDNMICMEFPWKDVISFPSSSPEYSTTLSMLRSAFHTSTLLNDDDSIKFIGVGEDKEDLFVELTPRAFLSLATSDIKSDHMVKSDAANLHTRGLIICSLAADDDDSIDFYSRFFGPKVGILEDPVTGSAHCLLAPYFSTRLNKPALIGMQRSERGGLIKCSLNDSFAQGKQRSVTIMGDAVVVMEGLLHV